MANIEQKVADTLELMALTSEAVLENGTKLDAVDNNVNGVGQSVVELHKTAEQVITSVTEQSDVLKEMNANQEMVHKATETLTESVNGTLELFEANRETLESIDVTLAESKTHDEESTEELIETLKTGNKDYTDNVQEVIESIKSMNTEIEKLDVHDEIETLKSKLDSTEADLETISEANADNDEAVHDRLTTIEDRMAKILEGISTLSAETQGIEANFETAIARLNNISIKLDTVVNSESEQHVADTIELGETNESEVE